MGSISWAACGLGRLQGNVLRVALCVLGVRLDAQILEYVSRFMTLFPGDVILTGRPPPLDGFPPHGVPVEASAVPLVALLLRYSACVSLSLCGQR